MARAWRIFGVVLVVSSYFAAAPFGYAAFAALQLLPVEDPDRRARALQRILTRAFGFMHAVLRVLRIVHFDPREVEGEIPDGPCVLVANHPTLMDTSAILSTMGNLATAVKPAVFRAFWARPLLEQAAHFEGAGTSPWRLRGMLDDALDRLGRGYRVLMFPEGTRSPPGGMHPFGRTAFEVAVRANVPVVPLVVECEPRWLSKEHSLLKPPSSVPRMKLRALPAVHPSSTGFCSRTLRDVVAVAIRAQLESANPPLAPSMDEQSQYR